MKADKKSMSWQLKVVGLFMVIAGVVFGLLVTFVLPGTSYLSSVLLLMLGLLVVCGLMTLVVGFIATYRTAIVRSITLPAILLGRLIGRG